MSERNNKPYLITTGNIDFSIFENSLLALGPWCAFNKKNKDFLEEKECIFLESPFETSEKIIDAGNYCAQLYNELLPQLSECLNKVHSKAYPVRYWRILLGIWLWHFIGFLYHRYKRVENALALYPDFYTHVSFTAYEKLTPCDPFDFVIRQTDESYNFQFFSEIINVLCPENGIKTEDVYKSKRHKHQFKYNLKSKVFNFLIDAFPGEGGIVLAEMYHLSNLDKLRLKFSSIGKKISFFNCFDTDFSLEDIAVDKTLRHNIKFEEGSDKFCTFLCKIIPRCIPKSYVEGFNAYENFIDGMEYEKKKIDVLGSAIGWYFNEPFKYLAAKSILNGAKIVEFQHGGGYGQASLIPEEVFSLDKDVFYTWGWEKKNNSAIRAMPSIHLSKLKDKYKARKDNILFIGTSSTGYSYKFQTALQPDGVYDYFKEKVQFLKELKEVNREKLLYRGHPLNQGWGEKEYIHTNCPKTVFLENGKMSDWMKQVSLVVIDHPYTSFLEALTINVPTVLYWDDRVHSMRKESHEFFTCLREAGILYLDPASAAKKVNEIMDDPIGWWRNKDIQKAREQFCRRFAYSDKNWFKIWVEELNNLT